MADASPDNVLGHWSKLCEGLQASPLEFYKQVEVAVAVVSVRIIFELLNIRFAFLRAGQPLQKYSFAPS